MQQVQERLRHTSFQAIARRAGIDASYVSHIVAGNRTPSLPVARRISTALGVSLDDLVEFLDSRKGEPISA